MRQLLQNRDLRFFLFSSFCLAGSRRLLQAAFAWHIYDLTGSLFHLGVIGAVQFVPVVPFTLWGGAVADRFSRRRIILLSHAATLSGSLLLVWGATRPDALIILYLLALALALAGAFQTPASQALLPGLVSRTLFPSAVTLFSSVRNLAWVSGPVALGFVLDAWGIRAVYLLNVGLMLGATAGLLGVPSLPPAGDSRKVSLASIREGLDFVWSSIREGLDFVWSRPVILSSMLLDMFAVIFASATALLPVYANDILQVGSRGYGLLSASLEVGTLVTALVLLVRPPILQPGKALLIAVGFYGLATIVFGLSRSFPLSLAAYALAGAADQISMVTRSTILQLATPDALRGRVSSVNMIFIGASNQLGAAESGFLAALTNATFSVVAGGAACLAVLGVVTTRVPELRRYRPSDHAETVE
ncbi:MAG: MFS transporter [Deltaproteobacteria bacterium]|nr:MFS transporter [Deltaproteobacteria bacterium]